MCFISLTISISSLQYFTFYIFISIFLDVCIVYWQVLAFYLGSSQIPPPLWTGSWLQNPWPNTEKIDQMLEFVTEAIANRKPNVFLISQYVI